MTRSMRAVKSCPGLQACLPRGNMTQYTYGQLKALWQQNGGNSASADIAAAVAMAESGGRSDAVNSNTNGSTDRGLWQINSVHGPQSTFDVTGNVKAAIAISNNGANWQPWTTFMTGAYKKFLSPTTGAGTLPQNTGTTAGIPGVSVSGLVTSAVDALLKMMGLGSVKDMLERAGLIILGFALVIVGIKILSSGSPVNVSTERAQDETGTQTTTRKVKTPVSSSKTTSVSKAVEAAAVA